MRSDLAAGKDTWATPVFLFFVQQKTPELEQHFGMNSGITMTYFYRKTRSPLSQMPAIPKLLLFCLLLPLLLLLLLLLLSGLDVGVKR